MFNKNNQQTTATILLYFCKKSWSNFRCKNYPHFFRASKKVLLASKISRLSILPNPPLSIRAAMGSDPRRFHLAGRVVSGNSLTLRNSLVSQATLMMSFEIIKLSLMWPFNGPFQHPHWHGSPTLWGWVKQHTCFVSCLKSHQDCSLSHLRSVDMHKKIPNCGTSAFDDLSMRISRKPSPSHHSIGATPPD